MYVIIVLREALPTKESRTGVGCWCGNDHYLFSTSIGLFNSSRPRACRSLTYYVVAH